MNIKTLWFTAALTLAAINSTCAATEMTVLSAQEKLQQQLLLQEQQLAAIAKQLAELKKNTPYEVVQSTQPSALAMKKNWQINSYGSLRFNSAEVFANTQDTAPDRRASTDLERVVLEFVYQYSPKWEVELELEYEHGGTGAALEYDGFEEFGEFESEIEAGGEVIVEKLQLSYRYSDALTIKFGHIFVPVGLGTELHKPDEYVTTARHWSESTLIPQVWHETGVNVIAYWQGFTGQALLTTGLNSEYFRTYRWVATGHQKRFEQVNADDLALTLRLDYGDLKQGSGFGISYYTGDTSGNRFNANNIEGDGNLSIVGLHGVLRYQHWLARGQYLYGELDDSQAITGANKTTAGLQPGNFAQLGSEADSAFFELAYDSAALLNLSTPFHIFAAFEYANPIKEVEQGNATERFDIKELSFGINVQPVTNVVLKAQVAEQSYGQANLANTTSFSLSVGYNFSI